MPSTDYIKEYGGDSYTGKIDIGIFNHATTSDISYWIGGNQNVYDAYKAVFESDPLERFNVLIITDLSASTISEFDVIILPDNAVPDIYLSDVDNWFVKGKRIICIDSATCYAAYSGYMWPESTGSNGIGIYWDYNAGGNDQKVIISHGITKDYNIGDILSSKSSDAQIFLSKLVVDALSLTTKELDITNIYTAIRDVPGDKGTIIVLGPFSYSSIPVDLISIVRESAILTIQKFKWFSISPISGKINPKTDIPITIKIDTTDLELGKYNSKLTITSNAPNKDTITIPINLTVIKGPNRPPFIYPKIPDITIDEDNSTPYILNLTNYGNDKDEGNSNLKWNLAPIDKNLIIPTIIENNKLYIKPVTDKFGSTTITLTVRDSEGKTASQNIKITIRDTNDPPKIIPKISDIVIEENNLTYILDLSIHEFDIDDSEENLKWSVSGIIDSLLTVKIDGKKLKITPKSDKTGVNTILLKLEDNSDFVIQRVKINVLIKNILPTVTAGKDMIVDVNETVHFNGRGNDKDGFIVKYEWDFDGDGIYDWSSETVGSTTYKYVKTGIYNATLRVTDNRGGTNTSSILINVGGKKDENKILGLNYAYFGLLIMFLIICLIGGKVIIKKHQNKKQDLNAPSLLEKTAVITSTQQPWKEASFEQSSPPNNPIPPPPEFQIQTKQIQQFIPFKSEGAIVTKPKKIDSTKPETKLKETIKIKWEIKEKSKITSKVKKYDLEEEEIEGLNDNDWLE